MEKRSLIPITIFALAFSFWLMTSTLSYDSANSNILVGSKVWSDFAAHIPLVRSFSLGANFPPQYPLFSGEPIGYHFLFYSLAGLLERAGLRIHWAINIPSILGLAFLLVMIFLLAKLMFKKISVAVLSLVFFLFNGSLSFLEFFKKHSVLDIPKTVHFPSFGPYDGKIVSAFWNLNIYTNQRHLALSFGLFLLALFLVLHSHLEKKGISLGKKISLMAILSLLPFLHKGVFLMLGLTLLCFFLLFPDLRRPLFLVFLLSLPLTLPQVLYSIRGGTISSFKFSPGYLAPSGLSPFSLLRYWFYNLGPFFFLVPLGFALSSRLQRKVFLGISSLFLVGNLFQFSPEIAANHKFFNLWLIVGNMFAAHFLTALWRKKTLGKILVLSLFPFLILSGVIDFFAVKNDHFMPIADIPRNKEALWIKENTPKDAVFLNSSYLYHPASLAGRKIFLGWPYFAWSIGYNTHKRDSQRKQVLGAWAISKDFVCEFLKNNNIQFVSIEETGKLEINRSFWEENFVKVYQNPETGFRIYSVEKSCL